MNPDEIRLLEYQAFFAAIRTGDLRATKEFLGRHTDATTQMDSFGTALHNAVIFGHEKIVEELVKLMTDEELAIKDSNGWTALAHAARDNLKMVECMVAKNKKLLGIAEEGRQMIPILIAAMYDRWDTVRYLYPHSLSQDLMADKGPDGSQLLVFCIFAKQFGIHIDYAPSISDFCIDVQNQENEQGNQRNSTVFGLLQGLPSRLLEFIGISRICKLKLIHVRSLQILDCMCDEIKQLTDEEMRDGLVYKAVYSAVQNGIVEVIIPLCKARPELLFRDLEDGKNIFHYAVECRQENVYRLLYGVGQRNLILTLRDDSGNSILHCAGMLSPLASKKLDRIAGAGLQMQRERQWYKEVERTVVPLSGASSLNKDGLTPPELFTEKHKGLLKDGEKWMKDAATSYTVLNGLIITIMFAAAFTVPGGNNQETGYPIFLNKKLFMVYIVSDAISLFSSAASALMFLSIHISRYAEDDFLKSLPAKMIIGISTLFISIVAMMIAFSSALFIMLKDKSWIFTPLIGLVCIPVTKLSPFRRTYCVYFW